MLPKRTERLEDWLRAPVEARCADARFEVRRARPGDYPAIFELLGETFGGPRSGAFDDWLYRRNPAGEARCWITVERATGEMVASEARFPWPFARGREALNGELIGDAAVLPRLQRQDVGDLRAPFRQSHPWYAETTAISWPNERSRRAAIKHGYASRLFGPLPMGVLPLSSGAMLDSRLPRGLFWARSSLAATVDVLLAAWQRAALGSSSSLAVEPVQRFESTYDRVTEDCMSQPDYWSPHSADFLNWRYLDHPMHRYVAIAAMQADRPVGYAVLRVDGSAAMLMELAASNRPEGGRGALIVAALELAREAGCERIEFFSTESFRHWPLLRRVGFVSRPSDWWVQARGPVERPISAWQLLPGDTDML